MREASTDRARVMSCGNSSGGTSVWTACFSAATSASRPPGELVELPEGTLEGEIAALPIVAREEARQALRPRPEAVDLVRVDAATVVAGGAPRARQRATRRVARQAPPGP